MAKSSQFGDPFCHPSHTADTTLSCLATIAALTSPDNLPEYFKACKGDHLNGVNAPFWWNWPLTEPYIVFGPEALHHFHKMFWDHDLHLSPAIISSKRVYLPLRSPSGRDHRNIQCYIIGVIAGAVPWECLIAMHTLNEFRYRTSFPF
ncbi:hypothetical protein EDC04DRAFT_2894616 [Pisolithus marmoratus]|nr:hypothetical protein EDC04DRAFT_2909026 [Pisolithus marmoratus]KAI6040069.1 hypothetical protein EDC04DRAFT_2894616 [Pisolithus marmoratus]